MPVIRVGTDCSGMEAPVQALRNLGVDFRQEFSCDIDKYARKTIEVNFPHKIMYEDLTKRDNNEAPKVDLYVAGFPCQPFSSAGKQQGFSDERGRGMIFFEILDYLKKKRPTVFILENVSRLVTLDQGKYLQRVLKELEGLKTYNISWELLNTCEHGLPQYRKRFYCVGILKNHQRHNLEFPKPMEQRATVDSLLEEPVKELVETGMPRLTHTTAVKNVKAGLKKLKKNRINPYKVTHLIDCDSSPDFVKIMKDYSPCLLTARARGYWITSRGRRMLPVEMMRFQGMNPTKFNVAINDLHLGAQLGNTMSVNVLERLLVRVLPAAGLVSSQAVTDHWVSGRRMQELSRTIGKGFKHVKVEPIARTKKPKDSSTPAKKRPAPATKASATSAKKRRLVIAM